jgi:hypothetical protein
MPTTGHDLRLLLSSAALGSLTLAFAGLGAVPVRAQTTPNASALQSPAPSAPQLFPQPPALLPPGPTMIGPAPGVGGPTAQMPLTFSPTLPQPAPPAARPGEGLLQAIARFGRDNALITGGLHWRVYPDRPDQAGGFRLLKEDRSAQPTFALPAGRYIVHAAFGLASVAKAVQIGREPSREVFDIAAGGLRIEGRVGDVKIPPGQISFDIFKGSQFDLSERRPLAASVLTSDVVLVPEGTYYILSKYGDGNAVVRSDIRVQSGKLTDVSVTHRAAAIMLKLVSKQGGEALANTNWAVLSPAGDVITESKGAFPRVILAEGEYRVIARNDNKVYQQDLKVITGVDGEIEVLAR